MSKPDAAVERVWRQFWLPIIRKKNGKLNIAQVKRELYDYRVTMVEVAKVYDHITNGRITKPNTLADQVIAEADDTR